MFLFHVESESDLSGQSKIEVAKELSRRIRWEGSGGTLPKNVAEWHVDDEDESALINWEDTAIDLTADTQLMGYTQSEFIEGLFDQLVASKPTTITRVRKMVEEIQLVRGDNE